MLDKWDSSLKCLPPERLLDMAPRLARPLVFTHGVFDRLKLDHVSALQAASSQGSCLVVALNTDASARLLDPQGTPPLHRLNDRARVIAALSCVSWVTWFEESTPALLLAALRPDVYVKGGDAAHMALADLPSAASRRDLRKVGAASAELSSAPALRQLDRVDS